MIEARGDNLVLFRDKVTFRDGAAGPAEVETLNLYEIDDHALVARITGFAPYALEAATAELDARATALEPKPNLATAYVHRYLATIERRDPETWLACIHPDVEFDDRRTASMLVVSGSAAIADWAVMFEMDRFSWYAQLVATAGERVALYRSEIRGGDGEVSEMEMFALPVMEIAEDGRIARNISFNHDDMDAATAELHARAALLEPPKNRAARVLAAQDAAFTAGDADAFTGHLVPGYVVDDRRYAVVHTPENSLANATGGTSFRDSGGVGLGRRCRRQQRRGRGPHLFASRSR